MSELFSIQLQNRQQQGRGWRLALLPTEQVRCGKISSDNRRVFGYFAEEENALQFLITWCWHPMWT